MRIDSKANPRNVIFYSQLERARVYTESGDFLGRLFELYLGPQEQFPLIVALQIRYHGKNFFLDASYILLFENKKITVKNEHLLKTQAPSYFPLSQLVLDRQIVDTRGKKVVRVNDLHFIIMAHKLRITHVNIGLRGMLRRLGLMFLLPLAQGERKIEWRYVQAIPDSSIKKPLELNIAEKELRGLHPAELADILEDLDQFGRHYLLKKLDPNLAAETISEMEIEEQVQLFKDKSPRELASVIENMSSDDAADLLNELDDERVKQTISLLRDPEALHDIKELLSYDEDCAGGLMTKEYPRLSGEETKQELMDLITRKAQELEIIYDYYIVDDLEKLQGIVGLRNLLSATSDTAIKNLMKTKNIIFLSPETPWQDIAKTMSKYGFVNLPVLSEEKKLLGVVSIDDVLPWVLGEK